MKLNEDVANMFMNVVMFSASIVHFILEKLEGVVDWWIFLDKGDLLAKILLAIFIFLCCSFTGYCIYYLVFYDVICNNRLEAMNTSGFFDDKTRICYVEYEEGKFIDLDKFSVVR